jgi:hypothetical protein
VVLFNPFLGIRSAKRFRDNEYEHNSELTVGNRVFYSVSAKELFLNTIGATHFSVRVEFCMRSCEDRTRAREDEESPLLETVARDGLIKTEKAGKRS